MRENWLILLIQLKEMKKKTREFRPTLCSKATELLQLTASKMARLSDRIFRLGLFSLFILGLITFLSRSGSPVANYAPSSPGDKSSSSFKTGSSTADLTPEQKEQQQKLQDAQSGKGQVAADSGSSFTDDSSVVLNGESGSTNYVRENATFISLARSEDLWELAAAVRSVEDRFNRNYHYDWVFLNDADFTEEFQTVMKSLISGEVKFGKIPKEHWSYPDWIDLEKAAETRVKMKNIIYGPSESYRHMCRFESGFFFQHPLMKEYQYYWRVEPSTKLHCDVSYDVFKFMRENKKDYGFTISIKEFEATIPTLWKTTKEFLKENPNALASDNLMGFISNDQGDTYNLCHFWTNFEVGNMDFWRGETYQKYFNYLDKNGGFFYERWGDAPVHSIAASLFLPKDRVHYFEEIGYYHGPYNNCPINDEIRTKNKCLCDPNNDFTWKDYSCTRRYYDIRGFEKPKGWDKHTG